ncbi:MAG: hypothetical protein IJK84_03495 [Bacteroidales bacterium]|nr:hypothetical protein [Bacteroidales bacterium]
MSRLFSIALLGVALAVTPVYAQRGGGGGRSGGGHSGGSVGSSRGGGGFSSSSRSSGSSFSSSRSSSSSSYSSSRSSSSSPSHYSSSRSSSSYSSPSSNRAGSTSSYSGSSSSYRSGSSSSSGSRYDGGAAVSRGTSQQQSRTGSVPSQIRSRQNAAMRNGGRNTDGALRGGEGRRGDTPTGGVTNGRPRGVAPTPAGGYAHPGNPGGPMPPSHRPMHPAPYFMHPHHHHMVHCHLLFWDPIPPRPYFWPGFWYYCNNYWYDYHVTDVVVVREYARETYNMDLITYAMAGDYMYALVNDPDGHTYLQIYDKNDKLLAEQQVSRKYCKMQIDPENGGCWIMKKRDRDPLLFLYTPEGKLLIYEADK